MIGCAPRPPSGNGPQAPLPATTEEMVAELRAGLVPLTSVLAAVPGKVGWGENGQGAPAWLTDDARSQVLTRVRQGKEKYVGTPEGRAALSQISEDLDGVIKEGWSQGRWNLVMCALDAYEILNPGSLKMKRVRERTQMRANRPEVVVKGFLEDKEKKDVYAFVHVRLRPSGEIRDLQVRKGEEFCRLRLVDFIGKLRGIQLEYLDNPGEYFRAMGP